MTSINTKTLVSAAVLAIAALGAANAFAANSYRGTESELVNLQGVTSTKARADVRAEQSQAAKKAHHMVESESTMLPTEDFVSTRARADVRMEAVAASHSKLSTGSL
jgi:hypothetical protein